MQPSLCNAITSEPPPDGGFKRVSIGPGISITPGFPVDRIGTWLSTVIQSSLDSVIVVDATGTIVLLNREAGRLFGYPIEQLPGKPLDVLFPSASGTEQSGQLRSFAAAKVTTGRRLRIKLDMHGLRANGEEFVVSAAIARITISDQVFLSIILRELVEPALPDMQQTLAEPALRKLALSTQQASEIEKRRFSKEIYDDLGQGLSVLKLDLDWLEQSTSQDQTISKRITQMQRLLDNLIGQTRDIASTLRPSMLDDFGLVAAVEWLATSFERRTGITCTLINEGIPTRPGNQVESAIFRVLQESLLNVERHAQASRVTIHLWHTDQHLQLQVVDDGVGLPSDYRSKPGCYGLSVMQERIYTLGGTMYINNNAAHGMTVQAALPYQS